MFKRMLTSIERTKEQKINLSSNNSPRTKKWLLAKFPNRRNRKLMHSCTRLVRWFLMKKYILALGHGVKWSDAPSLNPSGGHSISSANVLKRTDVCKRKRGRGIHLKIIFGGSLLHVNRNIGLGGRIIQPKLRL